MISSIAWVPAGVANPSPQRYESSAAEEEILQAMMEQERATKEKKKKKNRGLEVKVPAGADELPADLRMDEYSSDEEDGGANLALGRLLVGKPESMAADMLEEGDSVEPEADGEDEAGFEKDDGETDAAKRESDSSEDEDSDNEEDNLEDVPDMREFEPVDVEGLEAMGLSLVGNKSGMNMDGLGEEEDDASDAEDVKLNKSDAVILVAKTEDDFASLEVNVYDERTGNLYVHHDIPLPAFPLCLAHGQVSSSGTLGNFCAVGTFDPGIEIWNLDVINALEPSCVLGGEDTSAADALMKLQMTDDARGGKLPRGVQEPAGLKAGSHTDAVIALSWNKIHQQVIASGSADCTVKLWDITQAGSDATGKCNAATFSHHRDKVQSVSWHPREGTLLATASYDKTVALLDARTDGGNVKSVKIAADCEAIAWDPFHPEYLTVATEDGSLTCWDVRKFNTSSPLWTTVASEFGGVNDISYNTRIPGMFVNCSVDKTVAVWDTYKDGVPSATPPQTCGSKDMCAGKLFAVDFYPSAPWLLGCGGSGNQLSLWHLDGEEALRRRFADRSGGENSDTVVESKPEDFEAMMTEKEKPADRGERHTKKTGKGKNSKRKAHRRGR